MILQNKQAVVYGAGGSLGKAVASALATAGAMVFLTGRNLQSVEKLKNEIIQSGGKAAADQVDAFDEEAIQHHLEKIFQIAGTVDISFNAVGIDVIQGIPLVDMSMDVYVGPVAKTLQTRFLTAKAAGRVMIKQRSGVILSLTATPGGIGYP
jgi:3-oxoacyl-[acyl-carrier protein] reductase